MTIFGFAYALFQALAAIPGILDRLKEFAGGIAAWYVASATSETLAQIADAAAFASRASTQEERQQALDLWRKALSRPRKSL